MLGFLHYNDGNDLFRLNYQPKLSRLKNTVRLWSSRDLTPIGRNTVVKSCALSQLVFLFLVLPNPPESFLKELQNIIFDFIWSGNPEAFGHD
ncbi:LINE-1 retrotransposable element ORF2 protein [Holothuria leucospilota]|uniref:LINE-1 retrotransposable element ORF2 protein n=1 Tax=Holothuria leucospilota TaxID=206669 RepID=A0A9Q1BVG8_HOLLE|nr:LINE-1 retrotransposable element ORF2 protein [Holothuria leucospilota]